MEPLGGFGRSSHERHGRPQPQRGAALNELRSPGSHGHDCAYRGSPDLLAEGHPLEYHVASTTVVEARRAGTNALPGDVAAIRDLKTEPESGAQTAEMTLGRRRARLLASAHEP